MSALAGLLLLVQATAPGVTARADRTEVLEGEIVTLTITVVSSGGGPVQVVNPVLSGLELAGFREQTTVSTVGGTMRRELVRMLRLVARTPGTASIGAVRVRQEDDVVETTPIAITIRAAGGGQITLSPAVRTVMDRSRPVGSDAVTLQVVAVPDTALLGAQVDLVTLAWFPRDLRNRLRTPPTLDPPSASGAWLYERATPTGIVASREVDGVWYDLFVNHQVVFPLVAGALRVGRATVRYRVPLTYSFLSRELEHVAESDSIRVPVRPFPDAGRPAGFAGAAGEDLTLALAAADTIMGAGSTTIRMTMRGIGNVALWPEPEVAWPSGLRVYPGDVTTDVTTDEGFIGGTKMFAWLVVADSGGRHQIPPVTYPWYDHANGQYRVGQTGGLALTAPERPMAVASQAGPRPLVPVRVSLGARIATTPRWVIVLLVFGAPLMVLVFRRVRRLARRAPPGPAVTPLEELEHRFRSHVSTLVPAADAAEPRRLEVALRAAGIEPALAQHAARVADRLRGAVFGPGKTVDQEELTAEVEAVLAALSAAAGRHIRSLAGALVLCLALVPAAHAQSAEQLVDAGAWRAAADSFLARAATTPSLAAHWYNAGVALEAAGEPTRAHVAWRRAARLAPRDGLVRSALATAPRDAMTERMAPVYWVRPEELWLVAGLLWVGGWVLIGLTRPMAGGMVLGVATLVAAAGWAEHQVYARPLAFALRDDVPLREAPFGLAPSQRAVAAGAALEVDRVMTPWLLVRRGAVRGWVLTGDVARL